MLVLFFTLFACLCLYLLSIYQKNTNKVLNQSKQLLSFSVCCTFPLRKVCQSVPLQCNLLPAVSSERGKKKTFFEISTFWEEKDFSSDCNLKCATIKFAVEEEKQGEELGNTNLSAKLAKLAPTTGEITYSWSLMYSKLAYSESFSYGIEFQLSNYNWRQLDFLHTQGKDKQQNSEYLNI